MIDISELRRLAQAATPGPWSADARGNIWRRPLSDLYENGGSVAGDKPIAFVAAGWRGEGVTGYPVENNARLIAASNPSAVIELLDRLEAAENDSARYKALAESALRIAKGWEGKCYELRAKIVEMERQKPVAWLHETRRDSDVVTSAVKHVWGKVAVGSLAAYSIPLYLAHGAQPAPSVPGGWLRAIDEALVVTHLGVANAEDSYEDAKRKLDALIGWHCDVVTDPAVNGGWKLVPVEILDRFPEINQNNYNHDDVCNLNAWGVELVLAAAPEAKP